MKPVTVLLEKDGFLKTLFETIPCGVLVVDRDRRVQALNNVIERSFGIKEAEVTNKRGGEALRCIHAHESPKGCGYSDYCANCKVRNTALDAIAGEQVHRNRAEVQVTSGSGVQDLVLLVSAAPLTFDKERLAIVILEDITELTRLRKYLRTEDGFAGIVGKDPRMLELFETIREIAETRVPVLIQGDSGTGKELVAAAVHNESPRADKQFVPVSCGALPDGLLESELFGHEKGAFTGAIREKKGRFELADGGTIFLDEIGELSQPMQVKLLRVTQELKFERVGGEKTIAVDVRLVSATNKDLKKEVAAGRFREDLFYRLSVVPITLPPLRERKGDIQLLADHFLQRIAEESDRDVTTLSPEALSILMEYPWPGNVRELQNILQFSVIKSRGSEITPGHLPAGLLKGAGAAAGRKGQKRKLDSAAVADAMKKAKGNKVKAAGLLGVSRATLYRFLSDKET